MEYHTIIYEKENGIAKLTFNRPETLNAWNPEMQKEAVHALRDLEKDETARVLIVTGKGRGFSSGADVKQELAREAEGASGSLMQRIMQGQPSILDVAMLFRKLDIPVIGAINGVAV